MYGKLLGIPGSLVLSVTLSHQRKNIAKGRPARTALPSDILLCVLAVLPPRLGRLALDTRALSSRSSVGGFCGTRD